MDPIGPRGRFRVVLDGGEVVESDGASVVLTMPADRAHDLAHLLDASAAISRPLLSRAAAATARALARVLDDGAATLGDPAAACCSARVARSVPSGRRLTAVAVLGEREHGLSAVQRVAAVDAAARWLDEDAGDELAYALLAAVCSTDATASRAYLALLAS